MSGCTAARAARAARARTQTHANGGAWHDDEGAKPGRKRSRHRLKACVVRAPAAKPAASQPSALVMPGGPVREGVCSCLPSRKPWSFACPDWTLEAEQADHPELWLYISRQNESKPKQTCKLQPAGGERSEPGGKCSMSTNCAMAGSEPQYLRCVPPYLDACAAWRLFCADRTRGSAGAPA